MTAHAPVVTAAEAGLAACRYCRTLTDAPGTPCRACGHRTYLRRPAALQAVWAFWLVALVFYVPANLLPIMDTITLGRGDPQTIMGGVVLLLSHHDYFVATIVFVASIIIPTAKFVAIAWLALSLQRGRGDPHKLHRMHHWVELIGRWSMIDVFVVAVLSALVQLGTVALVEPGWAIVSFTMTVIFSMLSASALDPRAFWDARPTQTARPARATP